jgi:hypothetical protein
MCVHLVDALAPRGLCARGDAARGLRIRGLCARGDGAPGCSGATHAQSTKPKAQSTKHKAQSTKHKVHIKHTTHTYTNLAKRSVSVTTTLLSAAPQTTSSQQEKHWY